MKCDYCGSTEDVQHVELSAENICEACSERRAREVRERAERRERIATTVLVELLRRGGQVVSAIADTKYVVDNLEEWLDRRRDADEAQQ